MHFMSSLPPHEGILEVPILQGSCVGNHEGSDTDGSNRTVVGEQCSSIFKTSMPKVYSLK